MMEKILTFCRDSPWSVVIIAVGTVAGAYSAWYFELGDLSPAGRVIGGGICGAWFGLFPLGKRPFD